MLNIYVDADGCPVKQEIYKVAQRHNLKVILVANSWMQTPNTDWLELVIVNDSFDAADDWIAENIEKDDIAITADIPLASRCLKKGAKVLGTKGYPFSDENIGDALATRELQSQLREMGIPTKGPAPFSKKDSSQFLQGLEQIIQIIYRENKE